MIATCSGAFAQDTASAQPKVTVSPGSHDYGLLDIQVYSGSHHPLYRVPGHADERPAHPPHGRMDFRDVEKRLGECKGDAWSVDGKRVAPAQVKSAVFTADEPHKRTVQSLSFIFSVDASPQ
jgi:hypothetical protein